MRQHFEDARTPIECDTNVTFGGYAKNKNARVSGSILFANVIPNFCVVKRKENKSYPLQAIRVHWIWAMRASERESRRMEANGLKVKCSRCTSEVNVVIQHIKSGEDDLFVEMWTVCVAACVRLFHWKTKQNLGAIIGISDDLLFKSKYT